MAKYLHLHLVSGACWCWHEAHFSFLTAFHHLDTDLLTCIRLASCSQWNDSSLMSHMLVVHFRGNLRKCPMSVSKLYTLMRFDCFSPFHNKRLLCPDISCFSLRDSVAWKICFPAQFNIFQVLDWYFGRE